MKGANSTNNKTIKRGSTIRKIMGILLILAVFATDKAKAQDSLANVISSTGKPKHYPSKKIMIRLYAGYGLLTPGSHTVSSENNFGFTSPPDNNFKDTSIKSESRKGMGSGPRIGLGIGLIRNDFLNIGIDAEFMYRRKIRNNLSTVITDSIYEKANDDLDYSVVTITPYVLFKALAKPRYFLYNKLGILFTLPFTLRSSGQSDFAQVTKLPNTYAQIDGVGYPNALFTNVSETMNGYDNKYKIRLGIGLNVAFGISYKVNDRIRAFGEIFGNYTALSPRSSVSDSYLKLNSRTSVDTTNFHFEKIEKSIDFTTQLTKYNQAGSVDYISTKSEDLGTDSEGYRRQRQTYSEVAQKYTINMAVLGINIGIVYRF